MSEPSMSLGITLSARELQDLTGYKRASCQMRWLRDKLKLSPPQRADGLPVVSRQQIETALNIASGLSPLANGATSANPNPPVGPRWSK